MSLAHIALITSLRKEYDLKNHIPDFQVSMERSHRICGAVPISSGQLLGSNLLVQVALSLRIDSDTGISIHSGVVCDLCSCVLEPYDHGIWNFPNHPMFRDTHLNLGFLRAVRHQIEEAVRAQKIPAEVSRVAFTPHENLMVEATPAGIFFEVRFQKAFCGKSLKQRLSALDDNSIISWDMVPPLFPGKFSGPGTSYRFMLTSNFSPQWAVENSPEKFEDLVNKLLKAQADDSFANEDFCSLNDLEVLKQIAQSAGIVLSACTLHGSTGAEVIVNSDGNREYEVRAGFDAVHKLIHPRFSTEKNLSCYGPCAASCGHGHNWGLIARFGDRADNTLLIHKSLRDVWKLLHRSDLNTIMAETGDTPPTSEAVLVYVRDWFVRRKLNPTFLHILETPKNAFFWENRDADHTS